MKPALTAALVLAATLVAGAASAGPREDLLARYAAAVPGYAGFSAARGKTLHHQAFAGGKADTPACTSCHGQDPRGAGRTPTGKAIAAMAVSATPARYSDPAKVEKWFKRNCNEVLGRACSAQEKGDWLTYMIGQ
jgi:cytochrome c553